MEPFDRKMNWSKARSWSRPLTKKPVNFLKDLVQLLIQPIALSPNPPSFRLKALLHRALALRIVELTAVYLLPQARLCVQFWRRNKSLPWTF
jgi:hypothetical protein